MAVKTYSIRIAMQFKILESDQLNNAVQCSEFEKGCEWNIRVSYRRKQEKWEVRRYNDPHSCLQTSMGQDHVRRKQREERKKVLMGLLSVSQTHQ
ncbi:hypothetical protein PIB30_000887 [Stylosanthes scabra]|uniref:Transposase MuDR plant domain-containing protein n=1 Tax=Stylosanthes scabra TaxID=79078 RepID=A0ABU6R3C7_9FABA|nr:hypothetical protein [Stylosanthes scabra]